MRSAEFDKEKLNVLFDAITDEHKKAVMLHVLQLLATIDDNVFLDCIETFVITFAAD